jgi:hypothetical protein
LALPPYTAVIDDEPALSVVVLKLAAPPASAALPRCLVPLRNETLPPGVPDAAVTVAVKVTDCP